MKKPVKILILCTGNSCRSQMAEAFLKALDNNLYVVSAGTEPAGEVHPKAVDVMQEHGLDISRNYPKSVDQFVNEAFDFVITVCDGAKEACPIFAGEVKKRLHIGFDDPATVQGSDTYILSEFRRIRDEIEMEFKRFYHTYIK